MTEMLYNCEILELGKEMACDTLVPYYDMDEKAPVHGQHYLGYYNAAVAMLRELPENSLKLP